MKLKWQIGTIALLSLSFPVLMWLTLSHLNHSYQQNLLTAGQQQAKLIANSIEQYMSDYGNPFIGLVAQPLPSPVRLNDLSEEWQAVSLYTPDDQLRFKLARHQQQLYLWVSVNDSSRLTEPQQDRLTIAYGDSDNITVKHINRQAEGTVNNSLINPLKAYWHETADGYSVAIELPDRHFNRLGIVATDTNHALQVKHYGHYTNNNIQLKALFTTDQQWLKRLSQITPDNARLMLTDDHNRHYYDINKITEKPNNRDWLTNVLYPLIFATKSNGAEHNLDQQMIHQPFQGIQMTLTLAHPPAHRSLIRTFIQTIGWLFAIALLLLLLFLSYAVLLAWRIRRLSRQLRHVLDDTGTIHKQLPSMKAGDEVGDLSRDLYQLLAQIDQYTDYLKQLGSRLSHEMKTPIGIIQSSLDNVSHSTLTTAQQDFIERARRANHRLKFILNQLSSLSQLQQAINDNERHLFDLNALLSELLPAYQNAHHDIHYQGPNQVVMINGNSDLMAQMLDKVIENAFDFSPRDCPVNVQLTVDKIQQTYRLVVINQGPTIAPEKRQKVFDSLHSYRTQQSGQGHLGIGLYVAKLIANFHRADIRIDNHQQPNGVVVTVTGTYQTEVKANK